MIEARWTCGQGRGERQQEGESGGAREEEEDVKLSVRSSLLRRMCGAITHAFAPFPSESPLPRN